MMRSALVLLLACGAGPGGAIDLIQIEADSVAVAGARLTGMRASLAISDGEHSVALLEAVAVQVPTEILAHTGALRELRVRCADPLIREPRFACPALQIDVRSVRLGVLQMRARVESNKANANFSGTGPTLAGAKLEWNGSLAPQGWNLRASAPAVSFDALQKFASPWLAGTALRKTLAEFKPTGSITLSGEARGRGAQLARATAGIAFTNINLTNEASTIIAEKVAGRLDVQASGNLAEPAATLTLSATAGQVLAGPVLLDFNVNALQVDADARLDKGALSLPRIVFTQQRLARGNAQATLMLSPFAVREASVVLESLQFPAAYTSYLQIPLTTTAFNSLAMTGRARGSLQIRDNAPLRADFVLTDIALHDPAKRIAITGLVGNLRWWSGAQEGPPAPSFLQWHEAAMFGIEGGAARLDFLAHDMDFEFLKPARLPIFDGAVLVEKLVARGIGRADMQGAFAAQIEPISMARICKAFGWPEFQGQISGRVPGLEFRDNLLTLGGNLEATVFDGSIVASKLRVRDPLGKWPRLYGDIVARNLDLDQITSTFEFGGITGRLDADVIGLETFNWSPTAFDARLATPKGDRSPHRISQKAVKNLSNIGGGGGGVTAALQSGFLRFFDTFHYDRLGLSCKLQNDVCLMNGVEPAKTGYYIVKGSGIPRIDIIGNSRRVDWPTLMAQLVAGMNTDNIVVK
ncbi:MAG: hypothetical protein ABIT36_02610 [Steroidobacteraceae bacterium]